MAAASDESPSDTKKKLKSSSFADSLFKNAGDADSKKEEKKTEDKKLTKRQIRKQVNTKHVWPQQPRIQSSEARAKAYVRVSGLTQKPKEEISPDLDLYGPYVKFGRLLGSSDQRIRHQAVLQLQNYLKARCDINAESNVGLSELDLLKLWKGLWHTLYMADKAPVQEELSEKLASLIWCLAGTEEEDEYAGQAYMNLYDEEDAVDEDEDGEEEDGSDDEEEEDDEESEEDDEEGDEEDRIDQRYTVVSGKKVRVEDLDADGDKEDDSDVEVDADMDLDEEGAHDEDDEEADEDGVTMEEVDGLSDSEIPHCRGAHLASLFVRTFLRTVRREWGRMDKYRVDKFYSLARKIMHQVFKYMSLRHWNLGIIRLFNDAIFEEALSQTPNGLRYHLIDLTLEELTEVHKEAPMPLTEATFVDCLEPYFGMAQSGGGGDDTVQKRVVEKVLERFLNEFSVVSPVAEGEDEDAKKVLLDQVHVGTIAKFIFDLASDPETKDHYRKSLYELHKQYARRLKVVGKDVDITKAPMEVDEEEEEMEYCQEIKPQKGAVADDDDDDSAEGKVDYSGDVEDTPERREQKQRAPSTKAEKAAADLNSDKKKKRKKDKKKRTASEDEAENKVKEVEADKPKPTVETKEPAKKSKKALKKEKKARLSEESAQSIEMPSPVAEENGKKEGAKKDKNRRHSEESIESAGVVADSERSSDEKEKKKKKKKKRKASEDLSENSEGAVTSSDVEENATKKKKRRTSEDSAEGSNAIEALFDEKKKAKKAKKKVDEEEEEVVISKSDQKKAKTAAKEEKSSKKEETSAKKEEKSANKKDKRLSTDSKQGGLTSPEGSKRVKFGNVNHARSYKASMKALQTANPKTPPAAPELSILRARSVSPKPKHHKNKGSGHKKGSPRKKATDYF